MITGTEVVEYAAAIGTGRPYVLGAAGPNAYDCSGLVLAVFKHFGIATFPNLPREAGAQARWLAVNGKPVSIHAASNTPGAVLAIDIGPAGGGAGGNHIGFCRTPGISFEGRSTSYGIGSWPIPGTRKWTGAYLIPGVDYSLQEDDMLSNLELVRKTSTGQIDVYDGGGRWHIPNMDVLGRLQRKGLVPSTPYIELTDDEFDAIPPR